MPTRGDPFGIEKALLAGRDGIPDDAREMARAAERALRGELDDPGSGKIYDLHRASAPGESPAPETGRLYRSAYADARGTEVEMGSTSDHAAFTEFGTRKMKPRPWFRPAVKRLVIDFPRIVATGIVRREMFRRR
jgi:HK97 gp10 family phage protein